jgi:hypothetical protein
MVLPFSFWDVGRGDVQGATSTRDPGICAIYEELVRRLNAGARSGGAREAKGETPRWRELEEGHLTNLGSVLLEQIVGGMFRSKEGLREVSLFRLDRGVRQQRFGSAISLVTPKMYKRLCGGAGLGVDAGQPDSVPETFTCTVSDVSLVLCSTGVGLLIADLHLWDLAKPTAGPEGVDSDFEPRLLEFVNICQYYGGSARSDQAPVFLPHAPLLLAADALVAAALGKEYLEPVRRTLLSQVDPLVAETCRGTSLEGSAEEVARCFKAELGKRVFTPILGSLDSDSVEGVSWTEVADWLAGGESKNADSQLKRGLEALRSGSPQSIKGLDGPGQHAVQTCWGQVVDRLGASLVEMHLQGAKAWPSWRWQDLAAFVLEDLGLQAPPNETPAHFLNGDRFFIFSHVSCPGQLKIDPGAKREFAAHLSLREGSKYLPNVDSDDLVGAFQCSFETHMVAMALEGVAVLQAEGLNPEHAEDSSSVRFRQFLLVMLGLIYRFTLLDIAFAVSGKRLDDSRKELEEIQRLDDRVSHFTNRIYNSHVSNFSHLQALYEKIHSRFKLDKLWSDVDRDVSQYLERRKRIEAERSEAARSRFRFGVTWLVMLVGSKDVLELFSKLHKLAEDWPPPAMQWKLFALYAVATGVLALGIEKFLLQPRRLRRRNK